jgi:hypothetical protein
MLKLVASGSVSAANFKVSLVDGTAFVDFNSAGVFDSYIGCKLTITDTTGGDKISGIIGAMGDGEDLGANLLLGWNLTSGWSTVAGSSITDADTWATSIGNKFIFKANTLLIGALYKATYAGTASAGTSWIADGADLTHYIQINAGAGYFTNPSNVAFLLKNTLAATTDVTTLECQQVTGPSATGCTILAAPGGAQNWTSKSASFMVNEAITYTIEKFIYNASKNIILRLI